MKTPLHFIIIDDDTVNNFLCQRVIQVLFPNTLIKFFTQPEIALTKIVEEYQGGYEKESIVIFLDINMPQLDGWTFLEKFKMLGDQIQEQFLIYLLSSSIDQSDREKAVANPKVAGFISKPLVVKELQQLFSIN
jgi:CheY-like chemotaxis protein